jgi:hypothetical protein
VDLERFFNLVATVFGALGSIYVLKSIAFSSPELIAALSSTYIGFSSPQIDSLAKQKADNIVGIVLVVIALVITGLNGERVSLVWFSPWQSFCTFASPSSAMLFAEGRHLRLVG